ncbi:polysaccharide pyruvyl transferase family protein, partial [Frankia sp. Cr1]|uniref:polysaccharide pyruvyl transferase family protein n=1 Tax=Frankia sp. Cr1 TaxID=3073931 RepID=UPI002AD409ED
SRHSGRDDTILVALSHLAASGRELWSLLDRLADALTEQAADGLQVLLQPWQVGVGTSGTDDHAVAAYLQTRLDGSIVLPPPADLTEARASAASARLLVAMRFHALVAGAAAGTPVVAVAHEAKLAGLARRLGQPAVRTDASTGELTAAMRHARAGAGTPPASVQAETAQAEEGFRLLRLLIDHERWDETDTLTGLRLEPAWWTAHPPEPAPSAGPPAGTDRQLTGHVPATPPSGSP